MRDRSEIIWTLVTCIFLWSTRVLKRRSIVDVLFSRVIYDHHQWQDYQMLIPLPQSTCYKTKKGFTSNNGDVLYLKTNPNTEEYPMAKICFLGKELNCHRTTGNLVRKTRTLTIRPSSPKSLISHEPLRKVRFFTKSYGF